MRNRNNIKEGLVPLISFFLGFGLPLVFFNLPEDGWQDRVFWGILVTMLIFSWHLFHVIARKYPKLMRWSENSFVTMSVTLFLGGLLMSSLSMAFALLPLPHWLHILLGVIFSLYTLAVALVKH